MKTFLEYAAICALGGIAIFVVFVIPAWLEEGLLW